MNTFMRQGQTPKGLHSRVLVYRLTFLAAFVESLQSRMAWVRHLLAYAYLRFYGTANCATS